MKVRAPPAQEGDALARRSAHNLQRRDPRSSKGALRATWSPRAATEGLSKSYVCSRVIVALSPVVSGGPVQSCVAWVKRGWLSRGLRRGRPVLRGAGKTRCDVLSGGFGEGVCLLTAKASEFWRTFWR